MRGKLGDLCIIEKGKTGISKAKPGKYTLITTGSEYKTTDSYDFDCKAVCVPTVSSTGHGHASINRIHFYDGKFGLGTILARITSKDESQLMTEYLYLYLSIYKDQVLVPLMRGSANVSLTIKSLQSINIDVPNIEFQKSVIKLYNEVSPLHLNLIRENNEMLEYKGMLKRKILEDAFNGKLISKEKSGSVTELLVDINAIREELIKSKIIKKPRELPDIDSEEIPFSIPTNWKWVRLGEIGQIVGGGTPKSNIREYWENGDVAWITPADLNGLDSKYISKGKRNITKLGLENSSARLMPKGTVLFSSRAPIGYVAIAENDISTNQGFKSCVPYVQEMSDYIYYFLMFDAIRINEKASGTTFKEVSGTEVSRILIPIPPLSVQKMIVERIELLFELIRDLEKELLNRQKAIEKFIEVALWEKFEIKTS